jgi:AcrR family transcriptional regulator
MARSKPSRSARASHPLDQPLPAQQERSQATTENLLQAAEELLRDGGADAATLRAIADHAGVSLGIVYRRFRDKDAVLRAVYTRYFERAAATNARALANGRLQRATLRQLTGSLVTGIAEGYRLHRPLLRALVLYARTHPDADFRKRAAALNAGTYADLQRLFESHASAIGHRHHEIAVPFALTAAASILQERLLFNDIPSQPSLTHAELVAEVTRLVLSYLGIDDGERRGGTALAR